MGRYETGSESLFIDSRKIRNAVRPAATWGTGELYAYKSVLVGSGREGRWSPFLKERGIPLSSADKYVKRHADELARKGGKFLQEELKPPTAEEISRKVRMLAPGLRRFLRGAESVAPFVRELETAPQAFPSS